MGEVYTRWTTWMIPYIFLLMGIGVLVPWNVFISLKSYYEARFCSAANMTETNGSNIESTFATAYNLSSIITMILLIAVRLLRDHTRVHSYRTNGYDSIITTTDDATTTTTTAAAATSTTHSHDIPALAKEKTSFRAFDPVETSPEYDIDDNPNLDHNPHRRDDFAIERHPRVDNAIGNNHLYSYSWWFVILPFTVTILVLLWQLVLVSYVKSIPFGNDMYTITIFCIVACGITSALLGTGIVTVISSLPSIVPTHEMMNSYQYGVSVAGVAVSMINFFIALSKDPISYYTAYCNNRTLVISKLPTGNNDGYHSYYGDINVYSHIFRSTIASTNNNPQNEQRVEQLPLTCQPYTTVDYAVFFYFLIGIFILILCLSGFLYMQQYLIKRLSMPEQQHVSEINASILLLGIGETNETTRRHRVTTHVIDTINEREDDHAIHNEWQMTNEIKNSIPANEDTLTPVSALAIPVPTSSSLPSSFINVFRLIYGPTGGIFLTFCITLGLFPSWTSGLRSIYDCHSDNSEQTSSYSLLTRYSNDMYIPLTFVLFNVGDLLGRVISSTSWFQMTAEPPASTPTFTSKKLLYYASARLVFFPLLIMCPTSSDSFRVGWTVHSDVYSMIVQLLFALTNGYVIATSFAQAPKLLLVLPQEVAKGQQQQERMSEILSCAVNFGLFSGSMLSLLITQLTT